MKSRNNGIELLRIVLMMFIIWGHLFVHSGIQSAIPEFCSKWVVAYLSQALTSCAVNCFVIISGYYMIESEFSIKKLTQLWKKVFNYSVGIYIFLIFWGNIRPSIDGFLNVCFPILREQYWFFSSYILLSLFSPFIKKGLCILSDDEYRKLAFLITFVFYFLPIFAIIFTPFDPSLGYGIIGMVTLYILGGYIRRIDFYISCKKCIVFLLINTCVIFGSKIILSWVVGKLNMNVGTSLFYRYNTLFQLVNAILLFLFFKQLKLSKMIDKMVSFASGSVFSVYLIHEHPNIRELLWKNRVILDRLDTTNVFEFVGYCFVTVIIVFGTCILIDKICHCIVRFVRILQLQK